MLLNKTRINRLKQLSYIVIAALVGAGLIIYALKNQVNLYLTPKQVILQKPALRQPLRLGGLVKMKSIHYLNKKTTEMTFYLCEDSENPKYIIQVHYNGALPALFKEGKGAIAEGYLTTPTLFKAKRILAKHDEYYQPPGIKKHAP
jgi:cytochrome c-type biogenesis protein CcmE